MQHMGRVLVVLGTAGAGLGLFALLEVYWRWIGVALGYPPLMSGLLGTSLLFAGIGCLIAGRRLTLPGASAQVWAPEATKPEHKEQP